MRSIVDRTGEIDINLTGTLTFKAREFAWFCEVIQREAGIHLRPGKETLLAARLSRRLRQLGLGSFAEYIEHLSSSDLDGSERLELINCITTNKTDFFREAHHFEFLAERLFPAVRARAAAGGPRRLRLWSAGCSTGEEPYSLAMTILDRFGPLEGWQIEILASDIDTEVLDHAVAGVYPEERLRPVPEAARKRHFLRGAGAQAGLWTARPELKSLVNFRPINLNGEAWPMEGVFDAIFCRNVVIYFDRPTQQRLFERFARYLDPEGHLFMGHSESLIGVSDRFTLVGRTVHQLRRDEAVAPRAAAVLPARQTRARAAAGPQPKRLIVGEVFASREPSVVTTLLGSCVSACLFDSEARIGGMNHFLLPTGADEGAEPTRYGVQAMEQLIARIVKLGGDRRRLVAKVFGGAHVVSRSSSTVPEDNVRFMRAFLEAERILVVGERLGGRRAMEVWFHTGSGRARLRYVSSPPPELGDAPAKKRIG